MDDKYFEGILNFVKNAIQKILEKDTSELSFEGLYR